MIETVKQVCKMLSRGEVSVSEIVAALGSLEQEGGENTALRIKPADTAFRAIDVMPGNPNATPYLVTMETAGAALLTLGAVQVALGRDNPLPRGGPKRPAQTMFTYDDASSPFKCAVFVRYEDDEDVDRRDAPVIALQCRRDPRISDA
jgi:hypothetical protein